MVYVQALISGREPAAACYGRARRGEIALYVSDPILAEVRGVLGRPKLRAKLPALSADPVEAFLKDIRRIATWVDSVPHVFRYERDPKDEPYVNLAITAGADFLVSRDNDLLDLMADEDFRARYPRITILDPPALLRLLVAERPDRLAGPS
jgi:putative PIN family toxin of toxin-antitoxin system